MSSADPAPLHWVSPHQPTTDAEQAAEGRVRVRLLHQMRVPLPLATSVLDDTRPITTRPFRPGVDDEEFLAVNNRAFAWHPEQGGWTAQELTSRMAEPWFSDEGFLLHEGDDGRLDGFCWTKVHPASGDDPSLGEIFVIAADPVAHRTGLGRALTVAGLEHLAGSGLRTGMLYVEADNRPAVTLYERIGFTVHHDDAGYAPTG